MRTTPLTFSVAGIEGTHLQKMTNVGVDPFDELIYHTQQY